MNAKCAESKGYMYQRQLFIISKRYAGILGLHWIKETLLPCVMNAIMRFIMDINQGGMMSGGDAYPRSKNLKSGRPMGERATGKTIPVSRAREEKLVSKEANKAWQVLKK